MRASRANVSEMFFRKWSEEYARSLPYLPVAGLLARDGGWRPLGSLEAWVKWVLNPYHQTNLSAPEDHPSGRREGEGRHLGFKQPGLSPSSQSMMPTTLPGRGSQAPSQM